MEKEISEYVSKTLHVPVTLKPCGPPADLPVFIGRSYRFLEGRIAGSGCFLMRPVGEARLGELSKHVGLVQAEVGKVVIVALPSLSSRGRARLVEQNVAFIVPGNQFYVPELAMDLREYFKAQKPRGMDRLSPAAQAVLFHHMLRRNESATTPSELAHELFYTPMSIGRAFDNLEGVGLATTKKRGRERHIVFHGTRRDLMEGLRTLLVSPVRSRKVVWGPLPKLMIGGELALSKLSDLSPPNLKIYAMAATDWQQFAQTHEESLNEQDEGDFVVETWSYNPRGLTNENVVDPLSLYAQFWDHQDERIADAAEQLLERVPW